MSGGQEDRRTLAPTFTKGYSHIPHLREKLRWLYGYHPIVKTQYQLAKELGVSPGTLSTWLTGVSYRDAVSVAPQNPDCIPTKHYRAFMEVWGLPAEVLELADMAEFKSALSRLEAGRGPWEKLLGGVSDDPAFEIVVNTEKGLIDPDDKVEAGLPLLAAGDEIMLRAPNPAGEHGLLLMQDRFGWSCLRPNPRWAELETGPELVFPRQRVDAPPRFAELDSVGGMHRALAIFLPSPPPASMLEILMAPPLDLNGLNHIAGVVQSRGARLASRRFLVSSRRRRSRASVSVAVRAES